MPLYEPVVPARYIAVLMDYVRADHAGCAEAVLSAAGLPGLPPDARQAALSLAQADLLMRAIAQHTGRTDTGYQLGQRISVDMHGALVPALRRCATLDQALRLVARYYCLITPSFFLQYRRDADHGELVYRPAANMSSATLHDFFEAHAVTTCLQIRTGLQQPMQCDVYLSMDAPPHAERYRALRPARFHFGPLALPEVRFVFAAAQLDQPVQFGPHDSAPELDLAAAREGLPKAHAWADWVELMLREADGCQPPLAALAALLNIGERTLSRHLAREGVNFRQLALRVRHQRACELLESPGNSVTQIAFRLGYGHAASFSTAFRARAGVSPDEYRRARSGSAPGRRPA